METEAPVSASEEGTSSPPPSSSALLRRRSPLQIPTKVIEWLHRSYIAEDRCQVPKAALYDAYEEFCRGQKLRPKPPNVFGKIIKQVYPHVGTSRMGSHLHQVPYYTGLAPRVHPAADGEIKTLSAPMMMNALLPVPLPSRSASPSPPPVHSTPPVRLARRLSPQPSLNSRLLNYPTPSLTPTKPKTFAHPPLLKPRHTPIAIAPSPIKPSSPPPIIGGVSSSSPRAVSLPSAVAVSPSRPLAFSSPLSIPPSSSALTTTNATGTLPSLLVSPFSTFNDNNNNKMSPIPQPKRQTAMTEEERMLQSIKEKFLAYTQPVHVK